MNDVRLIDADELIEEYDRVHVGEPGKARQLMKSAPTIDAVPVVKCKDCKYYFYYGKTSLNVDGKTTKAGWCMRRARTCEELRMLPEDFCSYGERKGR